MLLLAGATTPVAAQDAAVGRSKHGFCASCHGIEGRSSKPNYPILAGQSELYLLAQLNDFSNGRRHDPNMDAVIPQLSAKDMRDLAAFFASVPFRASTLAPSSGKAVRGKAKANRAGCAGCHPRNGRALAKGAARIAGQQRNYLAKQLRDFRDGQRSNDAGIMHSIAQSLTNADIDDLAEYLASIR